MLSDNLPRGHVQLLKRGIGTVIACGTVYAVTAPCQLKAIPFWARSIILACAFLCTLLTRSTTLAISVSIAFCALAIVWDNLCTDNVERPMISSSQKRAAGTPIGEKFTVRAPYERTESPGPLPGADTYLRKQSALPVTGGAGSHENIPDTEVKKAIDRLVALTPPELLEAAQSNAVPNRSNLVLDS